MGAEKNQEHSNNPDRPQKGGEQREQPQRESQPPKKEADGERSENKGRSSS